MKLVCVVLVCSLVLPAMPAASEERVDLDAVTRIRQEGFRNSKVMETASGLMDGIGARLTGSPNMKAANDWTRKQLDDWGLSNAHLESWGPFGRGWTYEFCSARMVRPDTAQLLTLPEAWTPGTNGPVSASAIHVVAMAKEDLDKYKGKLAGKIVFFGDIREIKPHEKSEFSRYDAKELEDLEHYQIEAARPRANREEFLKRRALRRAIDKMLIDEKALAVVVPGRLDGGTMGVQSGGSYKRGDPLGTPAIVMAVEHYGRIARLLDRKQDVAIELDVKARFIDEDLMQYNTIAELPGTDKKGEVVMLGGHLDSWHAGTGATDNGAGVVAAMEAIRILKAIGVRPKRTIRIALWSGEEQGTLGSRAYVSQHFASRPEPKPTPTPAAGGEDLPAYLRPPTGPLTVKSEHAKLSAYFNLDNGTGKIRGIYAQENAAAEAIFESWIAPLKDLGVTAVTMRNTGSTDHVPFDQVGLPGFQFIQDEVEYETRTHHTNMDVYERLQREDLMQASVVMACFVYQAAMRDGMMPRKPMPKYEPPRGDAAAVADEKGPLAKPAPAAAPAVSPAPRPSPTPAPPGTGFVVHGGMNR